MYDRLMLLFPVSPSTHAPITSWHGLGHAQAGLLERDPLWFTRDRRLAAEHGLHLLGRRDQLVGLALRNALADFRLDLPDEVREVATGRGRLPGIDRLEGRIELGSQGSLQAHGEVEAVDCSDQGAGLFTGGSELSSSKTVGEV